MIRIRRRFTISSKSPVHRCPPASAAGFAGAVVCAGAAAASAPVLIAAPGSATTAPSQTNSSVAVAVRSVITLLRRFGRDQHRQRPGDVHAIADLHFGQRRLVL